MTPSSRPPLRFALAAAVFHQKETDAMIAAALDELQSAGCNVPEDKIVRVPGAMELPLTIKRLLLSPEIHGAVVLGIIERGQTAHGRVMADAVIPALIQLQLETMKPLGVGVLGPEIDPDQIAPRAIPYARAAAKALLSLAGC